MTMWMATSCWPRRETADEKLITERGQAVHLHGLTMAVKISHDTKGIRTTYGSPLSKQHIPTLTGWLWNERKQVEPSSWARPTFLRLAAHQLSTLSLDIRAIYRSDQRTWAGARWRRRRTGVRLWRLLADGSDMGGRAEPRNSAMWWDFVNPRAATETRAGKLG